MALKAQCQAYKSVKNRACRQKVPHRLYIEIYETHLLRSRILATSIEVDGDADDEGLGDVSMDIMSVTRR
jgi:hypothetical protein